MDFEAQGVCIFVFLSTLLNGALMQWTVPSRPMWLREKLDVSVGDPAGGHWGKKKDQCVRSVWADNLKYMGLWTFASDIACQVNGVNG